MTDIEILIAAFSKVERIDQDDPMYRKLCAILDAANDEALEAMVAANIRFVSKLAFNRMVRRGLVEVVNYRAEE